MKTRNKHEDLVVKGGCSSNDPISQHNKRTSNTLIFSTSEDDLSQLTCIWGKKYKHMENSVSKTNSVQNCLPALNPIRARSKENHQNLTQKASIIIKFL